MVDLWVQLISLAILIGLSGFFSGLEVALVGTSKSKVMKLLSVNANGAKELHKLISNPGWMMSSVNLGNNLVNIAASALATSISLNIFGSEGLAIAIGVMTFLILVFGEITPKTYCNANSIKVALKFARILIWFSYVFYPLVKMFEFITHQVVKLLGSSLTPPPITEEELKNINILANFNATFIEFALQYVFGVISPKTSIKNVITPIAIASPSDPNIFRDIEVAKADAAIFTKLFPRFTLDIIHPGLLINLCNSLAPFAFTLKSFITFDFDVPTNATSRPEKNPDKPINIASDIS